LNSKTAKRAFAISAIASAALYVSSYWIADHIVREYRAEARSAESAHLFFQVLLFLWIVSVMATLAFLSTIIPSERRWLMAPIVLAAVILVFLLWFPVGHYVSCSVSGICM